MTSQKLEALEEEGRSRVTRRNNAKAKGFYCDCRNNIIKETQKCRESK
jgi:hypothetical protein